jgi:hypothetical protein
MGGCCTAGCRTTTLISEQMTFLLLISILFGNRGGNGRLLYCGVQDQYCIETRTDDLSITHFNYLWEQGWELASLQRGAGSVLH